MTITAGTHLGPYEIQDLLGAGGMGEVYRARDPRLSREVAVKLITTDGASSPERLHRFETEARAAAQLAHPNVVTVFDVGTHDGHPYLVLELLEGQTLREVLRGGAPPLRQSLTWALETARGLGAAHERGIVHRDLKPENIFLTSAGRVKILDFGLAKLQETLVGSSSDTSSPTATKDTSPGVILGTIGYMSPEQVKGEPAVARSDVFALGAVLYELLAGQRAFAGGTAAEILASILRDEPPSLMTLRPEIPASVETVVRRCLGKHPTERFSSGNEVAVALETVLSSLEPSRATGARPLEPRGPYPGLSSFTEADAERFFGRESEVESLWQKLHQRPLLALIGPSGAGKTSFVRAGLLPSRPTGWGAIVATPGAAPMRALAQALVGALPSGPDTVRELLAFDDPEVALRVMKGWRQSHLECLLVLDQFEELFTLNPPEVQANFAELLGRLAGEGDLHVLLSLRDDFLIRCHEHEPLAPVFQNLTPLLSLGGEDLRRALVEPAKREGFEFEDESLIEEMLESVEGARGALPLLAFAVARLWEKRDREKKLLTRKAYEQVGGVAGALAQHAEQTLERIGLEREPIVRELFRNLVTAQWTRAVADREELLSVVPDRDSAEQVLDELISARLLTSYEVEGRHRIEIVHESLLRAWPRLVRWQAQDEEGAVLRDQLKQAAHLWEEKSRSPDVLWTGTAFQEFELWRGRYQGKLTVLEEEYSRAMVDRVRRQRRLRRGGVAAGFMLTVAVAAAIGISRQEAVDQALRAEASKLLALAHLRLEEDPTEALALTTASLGLSDSEEARVLALESLFDSPPALELDAGGVSARIPTFSPDGRWLAAAGHESDVGVWGLDGTGPLRLPGHVSSGNGTNVARWTRGGLLVTGLCCGIGERAHVWSLPEGKRLRTLEFGRAAPWRVCSEQVLAGLRGGPPGKPRTRVLSWALPDGDEATLGYIDRAALGATDVAFDPSGRGLFYARGQDVFRRRFDAGPEERDEHLARHPARVTTIAPRSRGSDGPYSRDESGELRLYRPREGSTPEVVVIPPPGTAVAPERSAVDSTGRWILDHSDLEKQALLWEVGALFHARPLRLRRRGSWYAAGRDVHPGGDWLVVSTGQWSRLTFWPLARPRAAVVDGYTSVLRPVAFSPDGRWLASTWSDDVIRLWPLQGQAPEPQRLHRLAAGTGVGSLTFSPDSRSLFVTGTQGGAVVIPLDGSAPRTMEGFAAESLLMSGAWSPTGARVAAASYFGGSTKELRLWNLETREHVTLDLLEPLSSGVTSAGEESGYEGGAAGLHFTDESTLYAGGHGGIRRWNLENSTAEIVLATEPGRHAWLRVADDGRKALVVEYDQRLGKATSPPRLLDLESGASRSLAEFGDALPCDLDPSGAVIAAGGPDGVLRLGRIDGGAPHLLLGHEGPIDSVTISPDLRWVASTSEDNTLRLWPMPDLDEPPLQTLPHDELIAKLKSLTNLRAVRDPESPTGWSIDTDPFPGWKEVPEW